MPTPADLRQALARLEDEAPDAARTRAQVLERVESRAGRTRRPYAAGPVLVAAVALLVAAATTIVLGVRGDGVARPVDRPTTSRPTLGPPPPATELTWNLDLPDPPAGTVFQPQAIFANQQMAALKRTDGAGDLPITVHEPDSFDPLTDMTSPQRVSVAGVEGYFGPVQGSELGSLVWRTPEGGWAQLEGYGVATADRSESAAEPSEVLAEQLSVARLVQFGRYGSPRLPFRLGWLPSDISVQAVQVDPAFGSAFFADAGLSTIGVGALSVARVDANAGSFAAEIDDEVGPERTTLTVDGRPAVLGRSVRFDARVLAVDLGDGSALLVSVGDPAVDRYPVETMRRVVEEADVRALMSDPGTWTSAPEALRG